MINYKEEILNITKELHLDEKIPLEDIPKLYLYMDQVITLFENELKNTQRNDTDKLLTKTMINNYTKDKILMPADGKKYSRNHIIMMILVYNLKQILSINDIKLLLNKLVEKFAQTKNPMELDEFYQLLLHIQDNEVLEFSKSVELKLDSLLDNNCNLKGLDDDENYYKLLLTVITLINNATMYKRLAESLIDKYFSEKN